MKISQIFVAAVRLDSCRQSLETAIQIGKRMAGNMAEILLLHGAWHGGWCWQQVTQNLQTRGHSVTAPDYIGLGARSGELTPEIGLLDHVAQIAAMIENKRDLIVCAHSYGGALTRILEDRLPGSFAGILYLEGAIPKPGQSILDLNGPEIAAERRRMAQEQGEGWYLPVPDIEQVWPELDRQMRAAILPKLTRHPLKGFTQTQPENPVWASCRHVYVYAKDRNPQPYQPIIDDFRSRNWETVAINGGHELMFTRPEEVSGMIDALARDLPIKPDWD